MQAQPRIPDPGGGTRDGQLVEGERIVPVTGDSHVESRGWCPGLRAEGFANAEGHIDRIGPLG